MTPLALGAERALAVLAGWNASADAFTRQWAGFNALYGAFSGNERERLMAAVGSGTTSRQAERILEMSRETIGYFADQPPGDMRFAPTSAKFRARACEDMRAAQNDDLTPADRLSHLLSAVYQVRCNLIHGAKDMADSRDERLVREGEIVVRRLVETLTANVREVDDRSD